MDIELAKGDTGSLLLGSSLGDDTEGYIRYGNLDTANETFDLMVFLGGNEITIKSCMPIKGNVFLEFQRINDMLTVKVNTKVVHKAKINTAVWKFDTIAKTYSRPELFKGVMYNLTLEYPEITKDYILWSMDDNSNSFKPKFLSKVPPPNVTGYQDSDITRYTFSIFSFNDSSWLLPELSYNVKIFKELSPIEKSLIKENNLIPKTISVPVVYEDINGVY